MRASSWQLLLIFLGQSVCVLIGVELYEHQRCEHERARVANHAYADLRRQARSHFNGHVPGLCDLSGAAPATNGTPVARLAEDAVLVVDEAWRVREVDGRPVTDGVARTVGWRAAGPEDPDSHGATPGTISYDDRVYFAVACPLPDRPETLLFTRPVSNAEAALSGRATLALRLISAAWLCSALFGVAYLVLSRFHDELRRQREETLQSSLRRTQQLVRARDGVIFALAKLAESRDSDTGDHLERIATYSRLLAQAASELPRYSEVATPHFVRLIGLSSALHDIGKVGLEDAILQKRGALTPEERGRMQQHTLIAGDCLTAIGQRMGDSEFLQMARRIALWHHERWDGAGYPHGLAGEAIPLEARIVAIADVYDALRTTRVYKPAYPHGETVAKIIAGAGSHFDPELVNVFEGIAAEFEKISIRYEGPKPPGVFVATEEPAIAPEVLQPEPCLATAVDQLPSAR